MTGTKPILRNDENKPDHGYFRRLLSDRGGNFGLMGALSILVVTAAIGGGIDYQRAMTERDKMQRALDAGVLAAVRKTSLADQRQEVQRGFLVNFNDSPVDFEHDLSVVQNVDGSVTAKVSLSTKTMFMGLLGVNRLPLSVKASAKALTTPTVAPCITALGSSGQDVWVNSGATWRSTACTFEVHSTASSPFIISSGSTIDFTQFCVKGSAYLKKDGTLTNLKMNCPVHPDPYAGALPEPAVSATCTTSGSLSGTTHTLEPGVHCGTTFNGSPNITFKPGLHIIKDRMIINSGATVLASGVTFYFPNTNSEIRANGSLTLKASAPTTGTYKGILMFEKTSDPANNANKVQYVFNGSVGESLEGIIYLPNRNVTYNSTSNVTAKISMVVNQMMINQSNWAVEPYTGLASSAVAGIRLTE